MRSVNSRLSAFQSAKCDAGFTREMTLEDEIFGTTAKFGSYVDFLFVSPGLRSSFERQEDTARRLTELLQRAPEMPAVYFANVWYGIPFFTVMLLAGLQGISQDYYEAASVECCCVAFVDQSVCHPRASSGVRRGRGRALGAAQRLQIEAVGERPRLTAARGQLSREDLVDRLLRVGDENRRARQLRAQGDDLLAELGVVVVGELGQPA